MNSEFVRCGICHKPISRRDEVDLSRDFGQCHIECLDEYETERLADLIREAEYDSGWQEDHYPWE
jgi:hypothetical protein